jgi:hypothetical protein
MMHTSIARAVQAVLAACVVVASVWFVVPLPAKAITISVSNPPSGTLGRSYDFSVTVNVEDLDALPIESVDLEIYSTDNSNYKVTCTDLPIPNAPLTTANETYSTAGGNVAVAATTGAGWGYGTASRYGYGYAYSIGWGTHTLGYGYSSDTFGYGYSSGSVYTGPTTITYSLNWSCPSDWPAGNYRIRVFVNGDSSVRFTTDTYVSFTLQRSGGGGGFGFGGGAFGAPPPGVTMLVSIVGSSGEFTQPVTAISADRQVALSIPEGTIGLTAEGTALSQISILEMEDPPAPPEDKKVIGLVYDFGPDGATFDPAITVTFVYDPGEIPEGVNEEDLVIAIWNEESGEWVELAGISIDPETDTITGELSHFTAFGVLVPVTPVAEEAPAVPAPTGPRLPLPPALPTPAELSIAGLSVLPAEIKPNEIVVVTATVVNTGGIEGSLILLMKIDGITEGAEIVTVGPGSTEVVHFLVTRRNAGSYSVSVDGLSDSFTVVEEEVPIAPAIPPEAPAEVPEPEANYTGWIWVIVIIVLASMIGVFLWLNRRYRWLNVKYRRYRRIYRRLSRLIDQLR